MITLAIDTSTRWAGVVLQAADGKISERIWRSDQNHGRELMPAIAEILGDVGLETLDVTHIAVALGPGGFSAVRVGISTVIGLSMPSALPVMGIGTHSIEAEPYLDSASADAPVYSLLPAGRGEVSWTRFDGSASEPESSLDTVDDLLTQLPENASVCGEASELLDGRIDAGRILSGQTPTRSPGHMLAIAARMIADDRLTPLSELRPIYARQPSITMRKP